MAGKNPPVMKKPTPQPKETRALLRHEVICYIKTLRTGGLSLAELGATTLLEVGHSSMLAALAKRTIRDVPVIGVGTPDAVEAL